MLSALYLVVDKTREPLEECMLLDYGEIDVVRHMLELLSLPVMKIQRSDN